MEKTYAYTLLFEDGSSRTDILVSTDKTVRRDINTLAHEEKACMLHLHGDVNGVSPDILNRMKQNLQ